MNGEVDVSGRALIVLSIRASHGADAVSLQAWVDTAFTGELVIPRATITPHRLAALPLLDRRDGWWRSVVRSRKSSGQPVERTWKSGPKRAAIARISIHR